MTPEKIERNFKAAGFTTSPSVTKLIVALCKDAETTAILKERERCAQIAESLTEFSPEYIAAAIREGRGNMTDEREQTTRWFGKVSADSGQLQSYGDPEVDTYIRSLEDRITDFEDLLWEIVTLMDNDERTPKEMKLMERARSIIRKGP
jgi:hypothetical protein